MFELRPNLCNPACKDEFEALKKKEGERLQKHYEVIIIFVFIDFWSMNF